MTRAFLSMVVVAALGAASCGGPDAITSSPSVPTTDLSTSTTDLVSTSVADSPSGPLDAAFDRSGVVTVDSFSNTNGGSSGWELSRFQVDVMADQVAASGGYVGAVLDDLVGSPGGLPFSYLIAGWLVSAPTPTAQAAADVMGDQEWTQAQAIVFPSAVLAMFVADAVAATGESAEGFASGAGPSGLMSAVAQSDEACSALAGWVSDSLDFLFDSLKANTDDGGLLGFFGSIWNAAVDLAQATVGVLIEGLTAPIVAIIADAIGVIGTLSMISSLLVPWSVAVAESEPRTRFAVGDEPDIANSFTATVDTNVDFDWPAAVVDCAAVAGFELPDPQQAAGSPVEWTTVGLASNGVETGRDDLLDGDSTARFEWVTGREPLDEGTELVDVVAVTATVTSTQIDELESMLEHVITNQVPVEPFGTIVAAVFDQLAGPVFKQLAQLVQVSGTSSVRVVHHDQEAPTSSDDTGGSDDAPSAWNVDPCALLTIEEAGALLEGVPFEVKASGPAVSTQYYGGSSCRWTAQISERVTQHVSLSVYPTAAGSLDDVASWNPWEFWAVEPLAGVGDDARLILEIGSEEFFRDPGLFNGIIVESDDTGFRLSISNNFPAQPDGIIATAQLVTSRL